ncbi:hypothetical protein AHAS_Ahas13G0161400 [Arachis hypogaea]
METFLKYAGPSHRRRPRNGEASQLATGGRELELTGAAFPFRAWQERNDPFHPRRTRVGPCQDLRQRNGGNLLPVDTKWNMLQAADTKWKASCVAPTKWVQGGNIKKRTSHALGMLGGRGHLEIEPTQY